MNRSYNFSPGPATLPEEVLQQAKEELLDWRGLGASVMEISHHAPEFQQLMDETEQNLRDLLNIPTNYKVLFIPGGGRGQFSMVPLNLLGGKVIADYLDTGLWSDMAAKEASRYCEVNRVASSAEQKYCTIPEQSSWKHHPQAAYFHYADNETVHGNEFSYVPKLTNVPIVADMSSNILSRTINVTDFALIYAAAQKNIGISGITLVIIREDLLGQALPITPMMFNYTLHAKANSLLNTPPTFPWYITGLVFQWLKKQGGIASIEKINAKKAKKLYDCIDSSSLYINDVHPRYRSRMNVVFKLKDENLDVRFLEASRQSGFIGLKGHKLVGGMRASLYNAFPEQAVDAFVTFLQHFEKTMA